MRLKTLHQELLSISVDILRLARQLILKHVAERRRQTHPLSVICFMPDNYAIECQWLLLRPLVLQPGTSQHLRVHVLHGQLLGETDLLKLQAEYELFDCDGGDVIWVDVFLSTSVAKSSLTVPNLAIVIAFAWISKSDGIGKTRIRSANLFLHLQLLLLQMKMFRRRMNRRICQRLKG
jgi:hypothetical protein